MATIRRSKSSPHRSHRVNVDFSRVVASWYSPRDGNWEQIGFFPNQGTQTFNPPGEPRDGNDWVLVLDKK